MFIFSFILLLILEVAPVTLAGFGPAYHFEPPPREPKIENFPESVSHVNYGTSALKNNQGRKGSSPCTQPLAILAGVCSQTTSTSSITAAPLIARSVDSSTYSASNGDTAYSYCALAIDQVDQCVSLVSSAGLDPSYALDCLCYELVSGTSTTFTAWAPDYFDSAFAYCPAWASTADTTDLDAVNSATSLCNGYGNYYGSQIPYTDVGYYTLAVAAAVTPVETSSSSLSASQGSAATGSVASPTSVTPSRASRIDSRNLGMLYIMTALIMLVMSS